MTLKNYTKPDPHILLYNRIEFKLYAASYYLDQIREFQKDHAGINDDMKSVHMEIAIDGFLAQLYGALDALFILINEKLNLELSLDQVNSKTVKTKLESIGKGDLLFEWDIAKQEGHWLHDLSEFRHQIVHRERLRRMREYDPINNEAIQYISSKQRKINFNPSDYMPFDMIKYFESSFDNVTDLINTIRAKDTALQLK